jgi:hypothetical protein
MLPCPELSIGEMLSDPIVRALMAADGVDPEELRALLRSVAERLRARTSEVGAQSVHDRFVARNSNASTFGLVPGHSAPQCTDLISAIVHGAPLYRMLHVGVGSRALPVATSSGQTMTCLPSCHWIVTAL